MKTGKKIAYFAGCTANFVDPEVGKATIKILEKNRFRPVFPEQKCCAIPKLIYGDEDGCSKYADQMGNATRYLAPGVGTILPRYLGEAAKYRPGDFEDGGPLQADALSAANSFAEYLGISPKEAAELIEDYCSQMSERLTGDRDTWIFDDDHDRKYNLILADREDSNCLGDITGHCHYTSDWYCFTGLLYGCREYAQWLNAAIGTKYDTEEVKEVALRIRMLMDSYRVLCARMIGEKTVQSKQRVSSVNEEVEDNVMRIPGGVNADKPRIEEFCGMQGYDLETGVPTRPVLEKLGLKDVADKLAESNAFD